MYVPCEKSISHRLYLDYGLDYEKAHNLILNHKRVDPDGHTIRLKINRNIVSVEFKRIGDFEWGSLNGCETSYGLMLKEIEAYVRDTTSGVEIVLPEYADEGEFLTTFFVKDLINNTYDYKAFEKCVSINNATFEQTLQFGVKAAKVIRETLLNIVQHNYRVHELVDLDELIKELK